MNTNNSHITEEDLQQAVALFYDGNNVLTVTAKVEGTTAQKIIDIAQEHSITLCEKNRYLNY